MVKYLVDQNGAPTGNLGESINIESDCEGDAQGLSEEARRAKEGKGEQFRAVFVIGSFAAYAAPHLAFFPKRMTGFPAGNHFSSIDAQTRFCLLRSNLKAFTPVTALIIVHNTSAKRRQRR